VLSANPNRAIYFDLAPVSENSSADFSGAANRVSYVSTGKENRVIGPIPAHLSDESCNIRLRREFLGLFCLSVPQGHSDPVSTRFHSKSTKKSFHIV
jgi:hypothetical protein